MGTLPWMKQARLSPLPLTPDDDEMLPSAASLAQQNFEARRAGANPGFAAGEEGYAKEVEKNSGRNPLKEKRATGANQQAFLDYLARISGEADAAMNTERDRQSMALAGAQAEDMKQAGINNIMASAMMGARNAPAQQSFMQAAQANPNQKAVAEQGKTFSDWLAKRYDIGKNAGEYNQAAYHDLMKQQNEANLAQRGEVAKREEKEFGLTLEQRRAEALQRAKDEAKNRALDWARLSSAEKDRALQRELVGGQKSAKAIQDQVEDYSKRFQKGASARSVQDIKAALAKKGDLAGYGAGSFAPDMLVSADGNVNRAAVTDLIDLRLRARTGANAPEAEVNRMKQQYNLFTGANDEQVREGLAKLLADTQQELTQIEAGYSPEAKAEFKRRGGMTTADVFGTTEQNKSAPVTLRNPKTGELADVYPNARKQAEADGFTEEVKP